MVTHKTNMDFQIISKRILATGYVKYVIKQLTTDALFCVLHDAHLGNEVILYDYEYDKEFSDKKWRVYSNGYAAISRNTMHRIVIDFLNITMEKKESVDHINWYKLDNRKSNLRIATMSEQNSNRDTRQDKKKPHKELIEAGVTELPRHVRWDKTEQKFIIEKHPYLLQEVKDGVRKKAIMSATKNKQCTILEKYQDVLARLIKLDELSFNEADQAFKHLRQTKRKEYEDICNCIYQYNNVAQIVSNQAPLIQPQRRTDTGRKGVNKLPDNCGVAIEDIPKHCYYQHATEHRGDCFIIERHPNLEKRRWSSTTKSTFTTLQKFQQMMEKYNLL